MRYSWVELNSSKPEDIDHVLKGCQVYHSVGITPIVTTVPGHTEVYLKLPSYVIPGIKTAGLLGDFNSLDGWKALGDEIAKLPNKPVVFEHETALKPYWEGSKAIKQSALHAGLEEIPDREYWWYPHFFSDNAPGRWLAVNKLQKSMTKTIQAVFDDVRFVDAQFCYPQPDWDSDIQAYRDQYALQPTLHIWYPKIVWDRGWPDSQYDFIVDKMEAEPKHKDWIFYPGFDRWITQGGVLAVRLGLLSPTANPH